MPLLTAWDVANDSITLMDLSLMTFTLFAIATISRGSDLRATSVKDYTLSRENPGVALDT